jgi:centromeric protein E
MEVYNEKVRDLLNVEKNDLKVYETQEGNISTDCSLEMVNCAEQMVHLLNQGNKNKSIGETQMNDRSSRSHTIFRIVCKKIMSLPTSANF